MCRQFPRRHANIAHYRPSSATGAKLARLLGEWWPISAPPEKMLAN